jgi:hypothetical protein
MCVAKNDDSLRGSTGCPNGGSELTWRALPGRQYAVLIVSMPTVKNNFLLIWIL